MYVYLIVWLITFSWRISVDEECIFDSITYLCMCVSVLKRFPLIQIWNVSSVCNFAQCIVDYNFLYSELKVLGE